MLNGWRVLDLTDHRGEVGPYVLADLGAAVTKVEPAGGCPSRGWDEHGLAFSAYNANKTLVELSSDQAEDRARLLDLIAASDVVFDSGPPGRLATLGIDPAAMTEVNPRVIHVLVTAFGADGPRAEQPATELTIGALGGSVRLQGTPKRAPVQMSVPQVWRHAGAEAAIAALVARRRMTTSGQAQFVDVSAQSVMTWTMLNAMEAHEVQGRDFERTGSELHLSMAIQLRHETSDGYSIVVPSGRTVIHIADWLIEQGIADPSWAEVDWATYDHRAISGEVVEPPVEEVFAAVAELARRHSKWDLFHQALDRGATFAPLNTLTDLLGFDHLQAREFWTPFTSDSSSSNGYGHGHGIERAPGAFYRCNGVRPAVKRGHAPPAGPVATAPSPESDTTGTEHGDVVGDRLPLDGLKVVDFSWIGVGPITAKALADHGATVIRVESEDRIDGLRLQPPHRDDVRGLNRSNFFGTFNTSKKSISLDLKSEAGRDVAHKLTDWADVVVESFTPGTIDRLGLGYEQIAASNPSVIMVSTSLLGAGSPVSNMAGYGYHAAAVAGFQDVVGWPDLPPDGPWLAYTDTIGPRFITSALLAALDERDRSGKGCHLEAAQLEIALQLLAPELLQFQLDGKPLVRRGNRAPDLAPQGLYPSRGDDQWLAISIVDDTAWQKLVDLLGHPSWAAAPELATLAGRLAAHDQIDTELSRWSAKHDAAELEQLLATNGIAAGVVQGSGQMSRDPQYLHRQFYRYLDHSEVGRTPYAGHQYRIAGYDHGPRHAAPCLGEHTFEVLTEILGLSSDEIADIAAAGALV